MGIKNYPKLPRIYVDMDGPMADFEYMMRKTGMSGSQLKMVKGIYLKLPYAANARRAVLKLLDLDTHQIWVATKAPSKNRGAIFEKLEWSAHHFPEIEYRIIVTPDKGCIGTPQDILIDDHPEWANANAFPGTIIKWTSWEQTFAELRSLNPDSFSSLVL